MSNYRRLIKELIEREQEINKNKLIIDNATRDYKKAIEEPNQKIIDHTNKKREIENTRLNIDLTSILQEVADMWNTTLDKLDVSIIFNTYNDRKFFTFEEMIKKSYGPSFRSEQPDTMSVLVTTKIGEISKRACFDLPLSRENFNIPQKDGKSFKDHLSLDTKLDSSLFYDHLTSLCYDNYKDMVLAYPFKKIYSIKKDNRRTIEESAILKAVEKNNTEEFNA